MAETTLTEDEYDAVVQSLTDLIALERDRLLGYPYEDLHANPAGVLASADEALEALDVDPTAVIWEEDRDHIMQYEAVDLSYTATDE